MSIKGIIFDLDGTLIDSMSIWDSIGKQYLKSKGITDIPNNLREMLRTMSLHQSAQYFQQTFNIKRSVHEILEEINSMLKDKYKVEVQLNNGVQSFLEKNKSLKMCIATETDKQLAESALKRLHIYHFFDFIITAAEVGCGKREPQIFHRALERLNLSINEVVVFEDAPHAIESAKNAGFKVIAATDNWAVKGNSITDEWEGV